MTYGLQKASVFSEDFPPYSWKWNVHCTSQISLQFLKKPNLGHFFLKNVPPVDLIFNVCYIWFGEIDRRFFSDYGCHGNLKHGVFVVSMARVAKGKNPSSFFRKLMWTSSPESFSPKQQLFL